MDASSRGKLTLAMVTLAFLLAHFPGRARAEDSELFKDVTASSGIDWVHVNGATAEKYLIETMGGGGAFLDYDRDGWMDIYLVNSGPHSRSATSTPARNALYRNLGNGSFQDVTLQAGVPGYGYGNGVAVGDYDNDGWPDLYVTSFGPNILYRNRGDGTFADVTAATGASVGAWSTSAAFLDIDNDGDLDLFVCRYLEWDYEKNVWCGERREGYRSYCHPDYFKPISNVLLENDGKGAFVDITQKAGVAVAGKGLGVVAADVDNDGWTDIYVANDAVANFLFHNQGNGRFEEIGLLSEVAYGTSAKPESGMGTDFGDFNNDGLIDLIVTNIDYEMNNLYINEGDTLFTDSTVVKGLGQVALSLSGFGVRFVDFDNDGDLDLVVLNGHPLDNIELYRNGVTSSEKPLLLENRGGRFHDISESGGTAFQTPVQGRALALGDYDNDGDTDLLFVNNGQPPALLQNQASGDWIGFELTGKSSNRDAVGAEVTVQTDQRRLVRQKVGGGSYQAGHDPRLIIGLLADEKIESIGVRWPSRHVQELGTLETGRYHQIQEPSPPSDKPAS